MDFDESELEVAEILFQFPDLIRESLFAFSWGSKKKRSKRRSTPLRSCKTPLSQPKSKIIFKIKRKTLENYDHHQNDKSFKRKKAAIQSSKAESSGNETSKSKKKAIQSCEEAESSRRGRPFPIPDLNLPPFSVLDLNLPSEEGKEEQRSPDDISESKKVLSPLGV